MQKWEYDYLYCIEDELKDMMNREGEKGWEVVGITLDERVQKDQKKDFIVVFKRPKN